VQERRYRPAPGSEPEGFVPVDTMPIRHQTFK